MVEHLGMGLHVCDYMITLHETIIHLAGVSLSLAGFEEANNQAPGRFSRLSD